MTDEAAPAAPDIACFTRSWFLALSRSVPKNDGPEGLVAGAAETGPAAAFGGVCGAVGVVAMGSVESGICGAAGAAGVGV